MTTIATDGRTMAGDGRSCTLDSVTNEAMAKVVRLSDGRIVGCAGETGDLLTFIAWLEGGEKPKVAKSMQAIVLSENGIRYFAGGEDQGEWQAPAAIGSGGDFAIGAMLHGASPAEAVEIAAKRDPFTGGMITVETL